MKAAIMTTGKKIIFLFLCAVSFLKASSQSPVTLNSIDTICTRIDFLSNSFERFNFSVNHPGVAVGSRVHYVDTLNKQYKKIIFKSELDTLTKTFYFEKDKLIEVKIEKKTTSDQTAKYQFKDDILFTQSDPDNLISNLKFLVSEGKRYFSFVRYKYK